jgi:replicative superfamily II helicase
VTGIVKHSTSLIASIEKAKNALSTATSIPDILDIRDKAKAIQEYVKAAGKSLALQNKAAEIKFRAERRAGEMLAAMKESGEFGQGKPDRLSGFGLSEKQSSRWQLGAKLPEGDFESLVSICNTNSRELTQTLLLSAARKLDKPKQEIKKTKVTEKEKTLSLVASVRVAVSELVESFGDSRMDLLIRVLRSELEALEVLNNGND